MNKQQIESLQMQLYMQGYKGKDGKALSIDGQMGPNTAYAAQTMLRDKGYNLTVDGIWGTQTQNAYNNYSSKIYDSSVNKDKPSSGIQNYRPGSSTTAVNTQPKVNTGSSLVSSSAATAQKKIYDSSVGKDWSGTVNQSYSSSPVQKKSYDSSVGKDWSGTVNQNYTSTKPQSSGNSGTSHAYESLVQGSWPTAAAEPKHSMGSTSSQKQQRDVIGEMLLEGLNELERILAAQSKAEAKPQPYQSLVQGNWPALGQQSGIGARSLPQSSGKQDYVSQRVGQDMAALEKKLQSEAPLRKVVNSDSASMRDFANSYETLRTQTVLNSMGYTGPNGEAVPETGKLDENTLYAWYLMRSDRDPFRSFSQEMHEFLAEVTGQGRIKNRAEYVIARNKENILAAAEEFGVDPQTLAVCIYTEQNTNVNVLDLADFPLFFKDTSIGVSQVLVSTAKKMEDLGYIERTEGGKSIFGEESQLAREYNIAKRLLDEKENIRYAAAYLKHAQDQWINAFPEIKTRPDILATLYNRGWGNKPPHSSPGANDFGKMAESSYARMGSLLELDEK